MKTVVILLLLILIGFGFLLSDNINLRQELAQVQQTNRQKEHEIQALQAQLDKTLIELAEKEQIIRQLTEQNSVHEQTVRQLELEIDEKKKQIITLQTKIASLQLLTSVGLSVPTALRLILFVPAIPASVAVLYRLVQRNTHGEQKRTKNTTERYTGIQLTESEVKEIIRLRRKS